MFSVFTCMAFLVIKWFLKLFIPLSDIAGLEFLECAEKIVWHVQEKICKILKIIILILRSLYMTFSFLDWCFLWFVLPIFMIIDHNHDSSKLRQPTGERLSNVRTQQKNIQFCQSYSYIMRKVWYHQIWIQNYFSFIVSDIMYILVWLRKKGGKLSGRI